MLNSDSSRSYLIMFYEHATSQVNHITSCSIKILVALCYVKLVRAVVWTLNCLIVYVLQILQRFVVCDGF